MKSMQTDITYPVYRKYPHNKTFFKINSDEQFEELNIAGNKYSLHKFHAKIHPDRMYIFDLVHNYHEHYIEIDEAEYKRVLDDCKSKLELVEHGN